MNNSFKIVGAIVGLAAVVVAILYARGYFNQGEAIDSPNAPVVKELQNTAGMEVEYDQDSESITLTLTSSTPSDALTKSDLSIFDSVQIVGRTPTQELPDLDPLVLKQSQIRTSELNEEQELILIDCQVEFDASPPSKAKWNLRVTETGDNADLLSNLKQIAQTDGLDNLRLTTRQPITVDLISALRELPGSPLTRLSLVGLTNEDLTSSLTVLHQDETGLAFPTVIDLSQSLPLSLLEANWFGEFLEKYPISFASMPAPSPECLSAYMRVLLVCRDRGIARSPSLFFLAHFDVEKPDNLRSQLESAGLTNSEGTVLLLPHLTEEIANSVVAAFPDLTHLSIDIGSIKKSSAPQVGIEREALSILAGLEKLQYLKLPLNTTISQAEWISGFKNLKVLDGQVSIDDSKMPEGLEVKRNTLPDPLKEIQEQLRQ